MKHRILIFVRTIGPYHNARFCFLAEKYELDVCETKPAIGEYDWDVISDKHSLYQRHILTEDVSVSDFILDINPSVIITHGWADKEYLQALVYAKSKRIPIYSLIDSTLSDYKRNPILETIKKQVAFSFDGFLAAGTRSTQYLNHLGITKDVFQPCDVVDNEYFHNNALLYRQNKQEVSSSLPAKYILCVSRFIEKKNIEQLILAYNEAITRVDYNYDLVIVGSGELKDELIGLVAGLNIGNRVIFFEFAQYDKLPEFYAHARALIIPSRTDQWGLVVNEAMASSLPVLVSDGCGCADDLIDENGLVFSPNSEGILSTLLKFNTFTEEELLLMGEKSFKLINDNFSINQFVAGVSDLMAGNSHKISFITKLILKILLVK